MFTMKSYQYIRRPNPKAKGGINVERRGVCDFEAKADGDLGLTLVTIPAQ